MYADQRAIVVGQNKGQTIAKVYNIRFQVELIWVANDTERRKKKTQTHTQIEPFTLLHETMYMMGTKTISAFFYISLCVRTIVIYLCCVMMCVRYWCFTALTQTHTRARAQFTWYQVDRLIFFTLPCHYHVPSFLFPPLIRWSPRSSILISFQLFSVSSSYHCTHGTNSFCWLLLRSLSFASI